MNTCAFCSVPIPEPNLLCPTCQQEARAEILAMRTGEVCACGKLLTERDSRTSRPWTCAECRSEEDREARWMEAVRP